MMLHAVSEASELRHRRRAVAVAVALLLLFLGVGNEFYKSFQTTYYYSGKERPRFSAMTEFDLRIHVEAELPAQKRIPTYNENVRLPQSREDFDRLERIDQDADAVETEVDDADEDTLPMQNLSKAEKLERNLHFAYASDEEMNARADRFPSVQERVKLYMSNWYTPPCDESARVVYDYTPYNDTLDFLNLRELVLTKEQSRPRLFRINSFFFGSSVSGSFDQVHYMDRDAMKACQHRYCKDMVVYMLPTLNRVFPSDTNVSRPPILYQFGDENRTKALLAPSMLPTVSSSSRDVKKKKRKTDRYPNVPVFKKIRRSMQRAELQRVTDSVECYHRDERIIPNNYHLEPIVFKLKTQRHYGRIYDIAAFDVPWEEKRNVAIFRGELNGNYPVNYIDSGTFRKDTVHQRCWLLERCWIVYQHGRKNSTLVDAKITLPYTPNNSKRIPRFVNREQGATSENDDEEDEDEERNDDDSSGDDKKRDAVDLYGDKVSLEDMLQYKALIMLEGNDVSSGLKWALFSNSVVLMPEPTLISWAMEERLEAWVHYVPIDVHDNRTEATTLPTHLTDVEVKMQWIMDNDEKARQIARASTLWIADLVLHPDAADDERAIFDEMLQRYSTHFVRDESVADA